MSKVTRGFYDGYVASAYWSTNKLSKPTHYIGYVTLNDDDINKLKYFGSVLITCFSTDKLGDVYPCYQQDFTEIGFDLSKDKPIGKHPYGNELALVFEDDAPPVQHDNAPKEKTSKYQKRLNDFRAWRESENPPLNQMTKNQIHSQLIERDDRLKLRLWRISPKTFETWWEKQEDYKASHGRKKQG